MPHGNKKHFALRRIAAAVFSVCLSVSFVIPVFAKNRVSVQKVTVGMFTGEGYAEQDKYGRWSGIDIEITENIAQTAGFQVTFEEEESVKRALQDLDEGKIDMLADIAKMPEREKNYLFSEYEQGSTGTNIFVRSDDGRWDYANTEQLKTMTFSCEKDNVGESDFRSWCSKYDITPDIVFYDSGAEAAQAVTDGKVDGYIDGEDFLEGFRSVLSFAPSPYYYVFAKNNTQLKQQVDAALAQIYIQDPLYEKELMAKYATLTQNRQVSFSAEEKEYIDANPVVRVAVLRGDKPYFSGTENSPEGIIPGFFSRVSSATGLSFAYQIYDNQTDAVSAVRHGSADIVGIFSGGMTGAYNEGLAITRKYTAVSAVMITDAGRDIGSVHAIAVKDRSQTAVTHKLPEGLEDATLVFCNTADECFNALTGKRADAVIVGMPSATYLVNQRNSSAYTITPVSSVDLELCAAAAQKDHTLITILNKGISSASFAMDGVIANNTAAGNSLKAFIARIPAAAIVIFACVMVFLVLLLCWAVLALSRSRKAKVAAVEAEAAAREQRIKAEASDRNAEEKNAFFSNISHDMRTPLNAIVGFIRLAKEEGITEKTRNEYLDKADRSSALLLSLVNDTLTFSKAGRGKLKIHPEPVDNRELFEPVIVSIREAAAKKNITFTTDNRNVRERTILADKLNVQKIFLNLLSNAVKYTPEGGHVSLHMYLDPADSKSPDSVMIVSDDGIGISEEFLPEIFEPFSQEKRAGYSAVGTGLGLSIVKQLVGLMGGTIQVQSKKDMGTTITVKLHFDETDEKVCHPAEEHNDIMDMTGRKVLLCEDNALNQEIASALLKGRGISVTAAENGQAGVELFRKSAPHFYDAILMDVRMPVMDGIAAAGKIRSLQRADAESIPIIAMTADAFDEDIRKCRDAGMNAHLSKPINPELMFSTLQNLIGRNS